MDKSLEARLKDGIAAYLPRDWFRVEPVEEKLRVGPAKGDLVLSVELLYDEWLVTVADERAHAHFDAFEDVIRLATSLLSGATRCVTEYRGEDVAGAWFEISKDGLFEAYQQSIYLSPFDEDEWVTLPGESWRTIRRKWSIGPEGLGEERFERVSDTPSLDRSEMRGWLSTVLGPPQASMRWTVAGQARFVFQAPKGWRRKADQEANEHNLADFVGPAGELIFRSRSYFRTAKGPGASVSHAKAPHSIEYKFESSTDSNWATHAWTLLFANGGDEMMSILELFCTKSRASEGESVREAVDRSVSSARYVPQNWNMVDES